MTVHIVRQHVVYVTDRQELLLALSPYNAVIWLCDQQHDVVAFEPLYLVYQQQNCNVRRVRQNTDDVCAVTEPLNIDFNAELHRIFDSTRDWQLPPLDGFKGGLMGFVGYDHAAAQHVTVQHADSCGAAFGLYDSFFRLEPAGWCLYGPDAYWTVQRLDALQHALDHAQSCKQKKSQIQGASRLIAPFTARWTRAEYNQAFEHIQTYLQAGDCYQVNLTQPFDATWSGPLLPLLAPLMTLTQAPFAGYAALPDLELVSCSPELFIAFEPAGVVVTRPIKGTMPRLEDPRQDANSKQQLMASDKDRSENLMIVDLLRNDLSIHATVGSVHVPQLFAVESFAQVHHLVSEIRATLKPEHSPLTLLMDALPGGSITGAPKVRAMQIIAELEAGPRGAYCGSLGYLNADGTGRFNILIRTLQRTGTQLQAWVGGGITIASEADSEYQECLDKISAILACVNQWSQADD